MAADGQGAGRVVERTAEMIRELHDRLTRFDPDSELSRLNADPRDSVPSSPIMLRFGGTVAYAGLMSGGLVDATLLDAIELAGYTDSIESCPAEDGPSRFRRARPGGADPELRWRSVRVDSARGAVVRPPGVRLDSGGIGKGLAADVAAEELDGLDQFSVSCVGDLRIGGNSDVEREILIASPWRDHPPIAAVRLADGAVATSGTTHRTWTDDDGNRAHHLIDPRSGRPAFTGVVQATALAPTAVEAEVRAKAALLSGPAGAAGWLVHGGAVVLEDGRVITVGRRVECRKATP